MAYSIDQLTGDIVINGFGKGIGDDPYSGLTDLKSVNPLTIPNEVSVSFATQSAIQAPHITNGSGSVVTTGGGLFLAATSLKLEQSQWIIFTNIGTATGISVN